MHVCTGLPARMCEHVTRYEWWSSRESHLLYTHVTRGAAHTRVLLKWIICIQMQLACTWGTCVYVWNIHNVHAFYKTLIMCFNEYKLAWQSLRRIVCILAPFLYRVLTQQIIRINISSYSKWVSVVIESYITWEVKISLLSICFQKETKLASMGGLDTQTGE